ncbi:MAG: nucleotidyltransferase domain-containing protein [Nanoarchaeota archaeon]|nr:nucleotidyltransferase domain-containing protein [Nanoarchaeota archaeon]
MLEKLIGSKARIKILELFLFYSEKNFYLREIARLTNENTNSIRRELNNLIDLGLLTKQKKGNIILYEINKKSPLYEPLKIMFMRTESLGKHLKELLKTKNIKYALIYGSFASGKETEKSDIDLLIIGTIKQVDIVDMISSFERKMLREINYIIWNENEFEKRIKEKNHLLIDIIKKPIIMIIGDEDEFRKTIK